jgi:hypothetical protein
MARKPKLETYTVAYEVTDEGIQYFRCQAENEDAAEAQCLNIYPSAKVRWINLGTSREMEA